MTPKSKNNREESDHKKGGERYELGAEGIVRPPLYFAPGLLQLYIRVV
jgi:hypothetical protein